MLSLRDLTPNQRPVSVSNKEKATKINLERVDVFPSNTIANFAVQDDYLGFVTGSFLPKQTITVQVENRPSISNKEFIYRFCKTCRYNIGCPQGVGVYYNNSCLSSVVPQRIEQTLTIELPRLVLVHGFRWRCFLFAYYPKSKNKFKPLRLFNVFSDGKICWGLLQEPRTLKMALSRFWTSKFNLDLTTSKVLRKRPEKISERQVAGIIQSKCSRLPGPAEKLLNKLTNEHLLPTCNAVVVTRLGILPAEYSDKRIYFANEKQEPFYVALRHY